MRIRQVARSFFAIVILAAGWPGIAAESPAPSFGVNVDPRVELCAVICRLAGLAEFQNDGVETYDRAVRAHFGSFTNHPSVEVIRKLHRSRGIGYNAPIGLALAADPQTFAPRVKLNPLPSWLDARWSSSSAREFLAALKQFAEDTKATGFFASQAEVWRAAEKNLEAGVRPRLDLGWYAQQFGLTTNTHFKIVPGLLNGPQNYGCEVRLADGTTEILAVVGTPRVKAGNQLYYTVEQMMLLIVHEFAHSFVNPWVDANAKHLDGAAKKLFKPVESAMRKQAYGSPRTVLYESVVRANTIRYFLDHNEPRSAQSCVDTDVASSFFWTEDLAAVLGVTAQTKPRFPGAADAVFKFFDEWGDAAAAKIAAAKSRHEAAEHERLSHGPQILKAIPADGDTQVDPDLGTLELYFDRPMDGSMSVYGDAPEVTGKPAWDQSKTVLKIPVKLTSGHNYHLRLNKNEDTKGGFRSAAGEPLVSRPWRFTVKSARP